MEVISLKSDSKQSYIISGLPFYNPFLFALRLLHSIGGRRVFLCSCCTMDSSVAQLHTSHAIARHRAFLAASACLSSPPPHWTHSPYKSTDIRNSTLYITKLASAYYEIGGGRFILRESTRYPKLNAVCKLEFATISIIIMHCKISPLKFVCLG